MDKMAKKIKELRKGVGLSQDEFALRIGVSRQTVIRWESGTVNPSAQYAVKICEEFSISPNAFWEEDSNILTLLSQAEQQAAITEKKKKEFSVKQFVANVLLIFSFLYLVALIVTVAIGLINIFAPTKGQAKVILVSFNTSLEAVILYVVLAILALASLFVIARYFVVKYIKRRKLVGENR